MTIPPSIFTIAPNKPFLDTLVSQLLNDYSGKLESLSDVLILLPTRRTCRELRASFLKLSGGASLLLPKIQSIGDVDAEELSLSHSDDELFTLPPPISSIKRQLLLAKLIAAKRPDQSGAIEQDLGLAQALGHLIDEIHTENLDFTKLPQIVEKDDVAEHWQITLDFLEIISLHWPEILKQYGLTDASAYRNALISSLNKFWQTNSPSYPIIMAGSTASIPAVSDLAKTISTLPKGLVILPGLDQYMSEDAWDLIEEGHPQATLKNLLEHIGINRDAIKDYTNNQENVRLKLISNIMLPATQTIKWSDHHDDKFIKNLHQDLKDNIHRYDCDTSQEEADVIALILRETLENANKTACVITTNRALARRIKQRCAMWNIQLDDTAGEKLSDTPLGQYLHHSLSIFTKNFDSVALLSFLKHDFTQIESVDNFRQNVRDFEKQILRGKPISKGFQGIKNRLLIKISDPNNYQKPSEETINFLALLEEKFNPYLDILDENKKPFTAYLHAHLEMATNFYGNKDTSLWSGQVGEETSKLLSQLQEYNDDIGDISLSEYSEILAHFISSVSIRPKFGMHPRIKILGQIEGRMVQADRVIMAGLNEGSWPPDPGHDPWMSRPMRQKFGLPSPERSITLAAHDFAQAFCAPEIFLTRSIKMDGAPTVPSRWLERFDTYLSAININPNIIKGGIHQEYLSVLDKAERTHEMERPAPCPPLTARPTQLSVTYIDKWMKDPYGIYAGKILKLKKLLPLNEEASAADKGIIFHEILYQFNKKYSQNLNQNSVEDFVSIALNVLKENEALAESLSFWKPRLIKFAENYIEFENKWRQENQLIAAEIKGNIDFNKTNNIDFVLTARVDRIDRHGDGSYAIIDYKSGGQYAAKNLKSGALSQLPLEGLILTEGSYDGLQAQDKKVGYLGYWKIDNSKQEILETKTKSLEETQNTIEESKAGLLNLITTYQKDETPYLAIPNLNNAPRYNDYAYLERVKEWAALDEQDVEEV